MNKLFGSLTVTRAILGVPALILLFTANHFQDINYRLINVERRLDQLQQRVDFIERNIQNQNLSNTNSANNSTAIVLELQRQQLALAEQIVTLEKRMLEQQKTIDQLREGTPEKKEKSKENTKPKP